LAILPYITVAFLLFDLASCHLDDLDVYLMSYYRTSSTRHGLSLMILHFPSWLALPPCP